MLICDVGDIAVVVSDIRNTIFKKLRYMKNSFNVFHSDTMLNKHQNNVYHIVVQVLIVSSVITYFQIYPYHVFRHF